MGCDKDRLRVPVSSESSIAGNFVAKLPVSRRAFIISAAAVGGGLAIGFRWPELLSPPLSRDPGEVFNWITVTPDNTVTIRIAQMEMGQGAMTAMAQLLAEELEVDWSKVKTEFISIRTQLSRGKVYGRTRTDSSLGVSVSQGPLRTCGAQIRTMFVRAASERLKVPESELAAKNSAVNHLPTGRTLTYGELAEAAADIPVPEPTSVKLKEPGEWTFIGKSLPRVDIPSKVDGSAIYGIDVNLPGMKYAAIAMSPVFGGTLKSYDATSALAMPGVLKVVEVYALSRRDDDKEIFTDKIAGLAVIADQWWQAKKAVEALPKEWDPGRWGTADSATILSTLRSGLDASPDMVLRQQGDVAAALDGAQTLEAEYFVPYLEHATLEPLNCTALVGDDSFEVWTSTQVPEEAIEVAAKVARLPVRKGNLHVKQIGGGFGRRLKSDYVAQAVQIAIAMKGTPIKLLWSREETTQHGAYRPASLARVRGAIDSAGNVIGWGHRIVAFSSNLGTARAGAASLRYDIPNIEVDLVERRSHVPEGLIRGVAYASNVYAIQCFMDELAEAAGKDTYEFQRELLDPNRHASTRDEESRARAGRLRAALDEAARQAGWGGPLGSDRGRGIAISEQANAFYAAVVEVTLDGKGWFRIDRVVVAGDPGHLVNPNNATAQAEGSVAFALTSAIHGQITIERGRVVESNFHDYPLLRIQEMPEVEVHWVPNGGPVWGGVGDPVVAPIAPALVNAIYNAGGPRIRTLPIKHHRIMRREK